MRDANFIDPQYYDPDLCEVIRIKERIVIQKPIIKPCLECRKKDDRLRSMGIMPFAGARCEEHKTITKRQDNEDNSST